MATQNIKFRTNYNNKMDCPCFIHLDVAPAAPITESKLENTTIIISTIDNSHAPVEKKIVDIARLKFKDVNSIFFHLSHGMTRQQYLKMIEKDNKKINSETEMALYYYSPSSANASV